MSETGSNPNWADGYIPPASEWNAWFGFKLDAASPLVDGAPFVSLAGTDATGPITGVLTVNDDIKTTADLIVNGVIYINPTGLTQWSFSEQQQTGDHLQIHSTGHFEQWTVTSGHRYWYGNNTQIMDLSPTGDLTTSGAVSSSRLNINTNWQFLNSATGGTGDDIQQHSTGNYDIWQRSNGTRTWCADGTGVMALDKTGDLLVIGSVTGKIFQITGGWNFALDVVGNPVQLFSAGNYDLFQLSDHARQWWTAGVQIMSLTAAGDLTVAGNVHADNVTMMTTTIDDLRALVQDLQTRLATLEAASGA